MHKWILKAVIQKGISFLPFGHKVNFLFQKYVTRGVNLSDEYFEGRLIHAREHYRVFRKYSSAEKFSHLEIGTGWYPVVPLGMFLQGADAVTTIDLVRFCNEERFRTTVKKYYDCHKAGRLQAFLPLLSQERLSLLLGEVENPTCGSLALSWKNSGSNTMWPMQEKFPSMIRALISSPPIIPSSISMRMRLKGY